MKQVLFSDSSRISLFGWSARQSRVATKPKVCSTFVASSAIITALALSPSAVETLPNSVKINLNKYSFYLGTSSCISLEFITSSFYSHWYLSISLDDGHMDSWIVLEGEIESFQDVSWWIGPHLLSKHNLYAGEDIEWVREIPETKGSNNHRKLIQRANELRIQWPHQSVLQSEE